MAKNGSNRLNKGYVGVNKFASTGEGIINTRNDYLNKVFNTVDISGLSPNFSLDFTKDSSTWQPYVTFTRGATATFLGSSGYITSANSNVPRITYDILGNTLGLIIEGATRQFTTFSEEIDNSAWTKQNLVLTGTTANVALAPDGTTTADIIIPNTTASVAHYLLRLQGIGGINGTVSTLSFFAKKAGNTYPALRCQAYFSTGAPVDIVEFVVDLNNGNVSGATFYASGAGLNVKGDYTYLVEPYPNDWYRISASGRNIQSNRQIVIWPLRGVTYIGNEAGDGVNGIYTWGHNWTATGEPLEYKKVDSAAINTVADDCYVAGSSFSSWFKTNGSFYVEFYNKQDYFNQPITQSGNAGVPATGMTTVFSTQYSYQKLLTLGNMQLNGNDNFGLQVTSDGLMSTNGFTAYRKLNKAAISFTGTGSTYTIDFSLNGSLPQSLQTNNFRPDLIQYMTIGSSGLTTTSACFGHYNGIIKKIDFYSTPLSKDQLRAITNV